MKKTLTAFFFFLLLGTCAANAASPVPKYVRDEKARNAPSRIPQASPFRGLKELNVYQRLSLESFMSGFSGVPDTLHILAVQIQFKDSLMGGQPGSRRPERRDSLFFDNEFKHLRDYYLGASRNHFHVKWKIIGHIYTLPENMYYYGDDAQEEERVVELVQTVIDSIDSDVDLSAYHTIFIIHAGAGQETDVFDDSPEQIWSSFYDRTDIDNAFADSLVIGLATDDSLSGEPYFVDNFIIAPANAGQDITSLGTLGIWAFEVGSRLGLLPLSDSTPRGFPDSMGDGNFCIMSWGLYSALGFIPTFPCVFNRLMAGWVDPLTVETPGNFRLHDINSPSPVDTSCLKIPISSSEYFLVVNRVHDTNFDSLFTFTNLDSLPLTPDNGDSLLGAEFDFFLTDFTNPPPIVKPDSSLGGILRSYVVTGSGIYIWHIDEGSIIKTLNNGYIPNDFADKKGVDLEEADGIQDLDGTGFFALGSYYDSFRKGHNDLFGPGTMPSSKSNRGAETGISIQVHSAPDSFMLCSLSFGSGIQEKNIYWEASSMGQPATPVDLDNDGSMEVVLLADTNSIYAFKADGSEYKDWDTNPATIEPFIEAQGAHWFGPPAFGDINGIVGAEIVAFSTEGTVFAWKGNGSEVADGDQNPLTKGVLFKGLPPAAGPMLVDVNGDGASEIALIEHRGDSLSVSFVNSLGQRVQPTDLQYSSLWPFVIQAQLCGAPAYGACGNASDNSEGIVIAWADTITRVEGFKYIPVQANTISNPSYPKNGPGESTSSSDSAPDWQVVLQGYTLGNSAKFEAPALGDLDADGYDEAAVVFPDGRLLVFDHSSIRGMGDNAVIENLRGKIPSGISIGDVDGNGTMEMAFRDEDYFYLYSSGGKPLTDWPKKYMGRKGIFFETSFASPVIADINGDGIVEVLFSDWGGSVHGYLEDGSSVEGFPRSGPAGLSIAPSVYDLNGDGELSLVMGGSARTFVYEEPVTDSLSTRHITSITIQSLQGSGVNGDVYWSGYRNGSARWGRSSQPNSTISKVEAFQEGTFIVYPNPVLGGEVHARLILNRSADLNVEIYNLEGERAIRRSFSNVNPSSLPDYVFDEKMNIGRLKSGVYFIRMSVKGDGVDAALVKTMAIKR